MKKILFSCMLALGIGANAQYNYVGSFEETDVSIYGQFGGGTITTAANCTGTYGGQLAISASNSQTGWMLMLDALEEQDPTQTNNGQAATVSIKYKKASGPVGTLYLALFKYNEATDQWSITPIGSSTSLTNAAITTCATKSGTIAAGTLEAGTVYGIGAFFVRTSGSGNVYIDDITIQQDAVATAPDCTTFTYPTDGAVIPAGAPSLTWAAAPSAVNYKLTVGTTPGGSDVYSGTVSGTSYTIATTVNTTYYAKVVPSNSVGDAVGCTEISFSTNSTVSYCTASGPASAQYDKITNVSFADINNPSPGSTAPYPPGYEDFTSVVGTVRTKTSYNFVVKSDRVYSGDKIYAFIDYNNNGTFGDPGERVAAIDVTSTSTNYTSPTVNVTIPEDATLGTTRMRVLIYDSTDTYSATLPTIGCGTANYGQVEDYTLEIKEYLAVSDVSKANISVYPNPFRDVLKISDTRGIKSISINDMSGRQVKSLAPATELNLSSLKEGLYIVNLNMEDGSVKSIKAIKK